MQHDIAANAIQTLAHQKGIPEEEIRKELALAISCAMKNDDPKAQDFWQHLSFEGNEPTTDFDRLTTPYAADGANKGETFFDLEMSLTPEEDREKDFEHLISKYQKLLTKYNVHTDGKCFHKESW